MADLGQAAPSPPSPAPRRSSWKLVVAALGVVLVVAIGGAVAWLASPSALQWAIAEGVARSDGRLAVDGAQGTLLGPLRIARITWQDEGTSVMAEDVAIDYAPAMLLRGRLAVDEIHVARVAIETAPGDDEPIALPESIAPPVDIAIGRLAIDRVEWRSGETSETLEHLSLAYAADTERHSIRDLEVRATGIGVRGEASIGTEKPFAVDGNLSLVLAEPHPEGKVAARLGGNLEALRVEANGEVARVAGVANATLAPFAKQPLIEGHGVARDIDLVRFDAQWPATRLDVTFEARPAPDGFTGKLDVANAAAGAIDAGRLPLVRVTTGYALSGRVLHLDELRVALAGGATLAGGGTVTLDDIQSRWKLDITGLDLKSLHTRLVTTALTGNVEADISEGAQHVAGKLSQQDLGLALSFDANYDGKTLLLNQASAQYAGGSLEGSGRFAATGAQPFSIEARATRFDPSRFGDFPSGLVNATLALSGTIDPALSVDADVKIADGSRLAGLDTRGDVRGRFTPSSVTGLSGDIAIGSNRVRANGAYGRTGDRITVALAGKRLGELDPLLPGQLPQPLAGTLDATLTFEALERGGRLTVDARASGLQLGDELRFGTLSVAGSAVHAAPMDAPNPDALRDVALKASLTAAKTPAGDLSRANVDLSGRASAHKLAFTVSQGRQSVEGRLTGAVSGSTAQDVAWQGRVEALEARGLPTFKTITLDAPVAAELSADAVVLGAFRLNGGGATVHSDVFSWRDGAIEARGNFSKLRVEPVLELAGVDVPWPVDLSVGGRWDMRSQPGWRGTVSIAREGGDVYVDDPGNPEAKRISLGISALTLDASFDGNRVHGTAELHAQLGGNAIAEFTLDSPAAADHPFTPAATIDATVRAHLPQLATLQPWIGTIARVQGQAIGDVGIKGTLAEPVMAGQVVGYGLRVDMPQHGVFLKDGRFRIVSDTQGLRLEELAFAAGEGTFTATGLIGLPRKDGSAHASSRIEWQADSLRVLNRPDRRLVLDGEGTLTYEGQRLAVRGKISVDQGNFEYRSEEDTTLASDIVVVGSPRPGGAREPAAADDGAASPFDVDLAIDLGRDLRFRGEGLDTWLGGRLQLTSEGGAPLVAKGTIRTVRGTYDAFGQKLTIDRGRVIFDGPIANPALDIVALRKNLAVEAGVEITGTVRAPLVRLTSNPPVPDNEKLSWLITGAPPGSGSAGETAAIAAASAALSRNGGPSIPQRLAQSIGLDDISLANRGGGDGDNPLDGQVVALGKRISNRLYVAFEQGLTLASNAVRIEYLLSRYFTVSAFAGTSSGLALTFRRSWR